LIIYGEIDSDIDNNIDKENTLIIIELTGGYEKLCIGMFYNNNNKNIILAEGIKVNNFEKSLKNHKAKTDKEDCVLFCEYGKLFHNELNLYNKKDTNREERYEWRINKKSIPKTKIIERY
jgi:hypothetical protein